MKRKSLLFFVLASALLGACKKDRDTVQPVQLTLALTVDTEVAGTAVPTTDATVLITNRSNGAAYNTVADADGLARFENIVPGVYDLVASLSISAEDFSEISGVYTADDVWFNYAVSNLSVYEDANRNVTLEATGPIGDWLFKQIYYAGSNTSQGASFRDVFVELYNNSNVPLYADSLYFAQLTGKGNNNGGDYLQADLQYDWSQSLNMNAIGDANRDYVYAKSIFMVPSDGTGTKHLVQPGQSIIIAATALDHTRPYVNNSGTTQNIGNPDLTIDLSAADFEVYLYPWEQLLQPGRAHYSFDVDNPAVEDLDIVFSSGQRDLVMDALGREAYVLFSVSGTADNPRNWPQYAYPDVREITAATILYPQIPVAHIIDGVQVQHPIADSRLPRRLPISVDASAVNVPGGQYSGQSLVRKTQRIVGGRRVLQDTNNSANDFGYLEKADPSKAASSFID